MQVSRAKRLKALEEELSRLGAVGAVERPPRATRGITRAGNSEARSMLVEAPAQHRWQEADGGDHCARARTLRLRLGDRPGRDAGAAAGVGSPAHSAGGGSRFGNP